MSALPPRVVQVTAWFPPYDMGGTEVYLEGLIGELRLLGVESSVLVPRRTGAAQSYVHARTEVDTYPVNEVPAPDEMRQARPHLAFDDFCARLSLCQGAIYHQHAWSRGCGPHHLRAARELGFRTVVTVHVPGNICLRGTMLRFGTEPCDGHVEERLCGACWAEGRRMPRTLAMAVARIPLAAARRARQSSMRAATALAARALGAERHAQLGDMIRNADRVVAVCGWLHDALAANGVPSGKLVLSRQGLPGSFLKAVRAAPASRRDEKGPLRLLYVGRWQAVKGVDIVVRAIRALANDERIRLSIHAVSGTAEGAGYEQSVRRLAEDDPRITFAGPLSRGEVPAVMARNDVLVVPSVWLETGPLVVLEAQAVGLYVVGSRLGGIAELIGDGAGGELVDAGNVRAWTNAIARLAEQRASGTLRDSRPSPVRTMATAASEMADLYRSL